MPTLAEQIAKSVVMSRRDVIKALPEDEQREAMEALYDTALNDPKFNQAGVGVSSETQSKMDEENRLFEQHKSRLRKSSGWTDEQLLQRGAIKENQFDKGAKRNAELESFGIITNRELPFEDVKLGFGISKVDDTRKMLSEHYGKPVHVAKEGGDIVYYDPEKEELVKVKYGALASIGHGIPMAADVAGTVLMGKTTPAGAVASGVARETFGSGVFTTAGEAIRLGIGKGFGWNELEFGEIGEQAVRVGGEAAAFTGGIGGVVSAAKGAWNFVKGGLYNLEEAKKHFKSTEEAQKAVDDVNQIIKAGGGEKKVKSTVAQKSDDVILASQEQELKASQEHAQRFKERAVSDQQASAEALDIISAPPVTVEQGMKDVGTIAREKVAKRGQKVAAIAARNTGELKSQMDKIGKVQKDTVGAPTADYMQLKHDAAKQAKDSTWGSDELFEATGSYDLGSVKAIGGYNPATKTYGIDIPYGEESKRLKKIYKRRGETAQYQGAARGARGAYVPPKTGKEIKPDEIADVQDLADLNHEISVLRSDISAAKLGKGKTPTQVAELVEMKDAFVADRNTALIKAGRKDILSAIEDAERATADFHATYKRSAVGDLMKKTESGAPVIKSKDFVDDMLKRDPAEFEQMLDVIGDNPELVAKWKEGLADTWKQDAFSKTGKFDADKSKRWFKDNEEVLEWFFEPVELRGFHKTGKFANKVAESSKRLEAFKNRANAKWGSGVLSRADPEGMSKFITGKGGSWSTPKGYGVKERISKIKYIKNMTAEHPAAWTAVKSDFKQQIRDDILDPKTGYIKPGSIAKWVDSGENPAIIKEMLGDRYYKDLSSLNDVIKIINKEEIRVVGSQAAKATIQAIRAGVAPPLTKRGRALTAVLTFGNKDANKRAADAILDEKSMREVADLIEHSANTRQFYEKAFSLGFALPDENEE